MIAFGNIDKKLKDEFYKSSANTDIWLIDIDSLKFYELVDKSHINKPNNSGHEYQVIIFRRPNVFKSTIKDYENFVCTLIDPPYYIETLIENGYQGIIVKLHEGSIENFTGFIQNYFKKPNKMLYKAYEDFAIGKKDVRKIRN